MTLVEAQGCGLPCLASTNVPPDGAVTGLVQFLPLETPFAAWADAALGRGGPRPPTKGHWDALAAAGYELGEAARRMQALYDRLAPNARPDAPKGGRPMIYAELTGGLGNQMFVYAFARALSLRCGEGLVLIDPAGLAGRRARPHRLRAGRAAPAAGSQDHSGGGLRQMAPAAAKRAESPDDPPRTGRRHDGPRLARL